MPLFENLPLEPDLLRLRMPEGLFPGYTIAYNGWTGNQKIPAFWFSKGKQGVHVVGQGPEKTIFQSNSSEATLIFGRSCGYVKISNCTIKNGTGAGKQKAIFGGVDSANAPDLVPYTIHLKNCVIELVPTIDADGHAEWPLFINQGDVILENCIIRSRASNEHALYVHGFGKYGAYIINTMIDGVGAEGLKFTARPQARYYQDSALLAAAQHAYSDGYHPIDQSNWIVVRNTIIKDWNQPWSWRGGAGMTVQGAGLNVLVEDSAFVDFNETKAAIAIDDSGVEHFGQNNVGGNGPANGDIIVRRSTLASGPGPEWYTNVVRIGSLIPNWTQKTVRSAIFEDCGIYGDHMTLAVSNTDNLIVRNCNTPEAAERARLHGVDTTHEAMLNYAATFKPVSQGYGSNS